VYCTHWNALLDVTFPPVGRLGLTSPPSLVLCDATTATISLSGRFACRSLPDTLRASPVRGVPVGLVAWLKRPDRARAFDHPVPHSGSLVKETGGSPTFPSSPCADMPRSQTPVVSCALAIAHPGLLPSSACEPSAFLFIHNYTHSGLNHAAYLLATPGFVRPLTGRHAGSLLTCWLDVSQGGLEP
jgi:hypothetical protein